MEVLAYGSARLDERIEVGAFVRVDVSGDGDDEGVAGAEVGGVGRDAKTGGVCSDLKVRL